MKLYESGMTRNALVRLGRCLTERFRKHLMDILVYSDTPVSNHSPDNKDISDACVTAIKLCYSGSSVKLDM